MVRKVSIETCSQESRHFSDERFNANLGSKRYYIQSAYSMPTEEKRIQEKASLISVKDSFKKIILVKDVVKISRDEDGIMMMNIYDFLLNKDSLDY